MDLALKILVWAVLVTLVYWGLIGLAHLVTWLIGG